MIGTIVGLIAGFIGMTALTLGLFGHWGYLGLMSVAPLWLVVAALFVRLEVLYASSD